MSLIPGHRLVVHTDRLQTAIHQLGEMAARGLAAVDDAEIADETEVLRRLGAPAELEVTSPAGREQRMFGPHDVGDSAAAWSVWVDRRVRGLGLRQTRRQVESMQSAIVALQRRGFTVAPEMVAAVEHISDRLAMHEQTARASNRQFEAKAVAVAQAWLREVQADLTSVQKSYGLHTVTAKGGTRRVIAANTNAVAALQAGAERLQELLQRQAPPGSPWRPEAEADHQEMQALLRDYPILASLSPKQVDGLVSGGASAFLVDYAHARQRVITSLQDDLTAHPDKVWRLRPVIERAIGEMGLNSASTTAAYARSRVVDTEDDDALRANFMAVAGLGLTVAAMLMAGPAGMAVAAAAWGADASSAAVGLEQGWFRYRAYAIHPGAKLRMTPEGAGVGWLLESLGLAAGSLAAAGWVGSVLGRFLQEGDEVTAALKKSVDAIGARRTAAVFRHVDTERGLALLREVDPATLAGWLTKLDADTIGWALQTLNPMALQHLLRTTGAQTIKAMHSKMSGRMASRLIHDLGVEKALAIANSAEIRGLTAMYARHPDLVRKALDFDASLGGAWTDDGLLALSHLADHEAKLILQAFMGGQKDAQSVLSSLNAAQMRKVAGAIEAKQAGNHAAIGNLLQELKLSKPRGKLIGFSVDREAKRVRELRFAKTTSKVGDVAFELQLPHGLVKRYGDDLQAVLRRADVPESVRQALRDLIVRIDESGRFEAAGVRAWLKGATTRNDLGSIMAELRVGLRIVDEGKLMPGTKIWPSAKSGARYDLGRGQIADLRAGGKEKIMAEADLLYVDKAGVVHVVEVKTTAQALARRVADDATKKRRYLEGSAQWAAQDPSTRLAETVAETSSGWLDFTARFRNQVPFENLAPSNTVTLEIEGVAMDCGQWERFFRWADGKDDVSSGLRDALREWENSTR